MDPRNLSDRQPCFDIGPDEIGGLDSLHGVQLRVLMQIFPDALDNIPDRSCPA